MELASVVKKIEITVDIVTGEVGIEYDDMSYFEVLGALETAKMGVIRDFVQESG